MTETTEVTCKREIELDFPAENVQKATDKVARNIARLARIPGFRPGKAPITIVRRRFADDIQGEVLQALVPEYLEKALDEKKLVPIMRPEVDKVEFKEGEPLQFRAVFEVLPEFELGDYKNLPIQSMTSKSAKLRSTRPSKKCRSAPPHSCRSKTGAQGRRLRPDQASGRPRPAAASRSKPRTSLPHRSGGNAARFTENLRGANPGDTKAIPGHLPDDYPDANSRKELRLHWKSKPSRKRSCRN